MARDERAVSFSHFSGCIQTGATCLDTFSPSSPLFLRLSILQVMRTGQDNKGISEGEGDGTKRSRLNTEEGVKS